MGDGNIASGSYMAYLVEFYSGFCQKSFCRGDPTVRYLDNHCRIFGEQNLHKFSFASTDKSFGCDVKTATGVGKCHFKKCGYKTSGRYVVGSKQPALFYKFLYGAKCSHECSRISNGRSVRTYCVERLCQC